MINPIDPPQAPDETQRGHGARRALLAFLIAIVALLVFDNTDLPLRLRASNEHIDKVSGAISAGWDVALAEIGEDPHLQPNPPTGKLPLCDDVSQYQIPAYEKAFGWMRATSEGMRLYDMLVEEGVCIHTGSLPYNSAYARISWDPVAGWSNTVILVDQLFISSLYADVLAAVLIHEATHVDRSVRQISCYVVNACTLLPNGVSVDEEVAAHGAEAEFWIAMYGKDGKARAMAQDQSENVLTSEYLKGQGSFYLFVADQRSDPREGEGIT